VGRSIAFQLDEDEEKPLYLNLASSILREIERGRLKPGDALPGTRALANSLGIHRNTVDSAYQELVLQGWLVAEPSRGTFVARDLPEDPPPSGMAGKSRTPETHGARMPATPPLLTISDGVPDPRLMPRAELARAFRRALAAPSFLAAPGYGDMLGNELLRAALSDYLADERGLTIAADDILVTRGSQMALFLTARTVAGPGQTVAVETPGYPLAWSAFRAAGARVVGIPVDADGISTDHLAALAKRDSSLRAVYITPHHQYPTTVTLSSSRRPTLMDIARQRAITVIEDDYDHDYRFDGRPVLPLVARSSSDLEIIYIGSLSKLLAPGIRLGYVVAAPHRLQQMAAMRAVIDRQGDVPLEYALAQLIADGDLRRHAHKARRVYRARRDILAAEIRDRLADRLAFTLPAGGLALWLRLTAGEDRAWAERAARCGLGLMPGSAFALDPERAVQAFRFGFANLDAAELRRAVELLFRSRP
jgi:GntR family transcriptional regulator / MocR family aminotransferase